MCAVHAQDVVLPPIKEPTEEERHLVVRSICNEQALLVLLGQSAAWWHLSCKGLWVWRPLRRLPGVAQRVWRELGSFYKSSAYHLDPPSAKKAKKGATHSHVDASRARALSPSAGPCCNRSQAYDTTLGAFITIVKCMTGSVLDDPYASAADRKTAAERPPLTSVLTLDPFYLPAELFSDADQRWGALSTHMQRWCSGTQRFLSLKVHLWRSILIWRILHGAARQFVACHVLSRSHVRQPLAVCMCRASAKAASSQSYVPFASANSTAEAGMHLGQHHPLPVATILQLQI